MDIDYKATWRVNLGMDFYQTCHFAKNNVQELNPLWREMVRKKDYAGLALAWAGTAYLAERVADRTKNGFIWLSASELLVVAYNTKRHGIGFPVVVVRF